MIERPRLHDAAVFERGERLFVRGPRMGFLVEAQRREFTRRLLGELDGSRSIEELLRDAGGIEGFYALHLLRDLEAFGMLDGDGVAVTGTSPEAAPPPRLSGHRLAIVGGTFAESLAASLAALGADARTRDRADAAESAEFLVVPFEMPDLRSLEQWNRELLARARPWAPLFAMGGEVIAGPWIDPGRSACFRCFELRWLAMSPAIAVENAFFEHLRSGGFESESPAPVDRAATVLAHLLAAGPPVIDARSRVVVGSAKGELEIHPLEQDPTCDVCEHVGAPVGITLDEASWARIRDLPASSLTDLAGRLAPLTEGACALARVEARAALDLAPGRPDVVLARFAVPGPERVRGAQSNFCHGTAMSRKDAATLALVEALERYSGLSAPRDTVSSTYDAIASDAIHPTDLPLFSRAQYEGRGFPFVPFRADRSIEWVWGLSLTTGRRRLVPRASAYFGEDDSLLEETSSGVAAHSSPAEAVLRGVLELIERDALMIHWLHRLTPPRRDPDGIDGTLGIPAYVRERGYELFLADVTTDVGVSSALAMAVRHDGAGPALLVGSGASLSAGGAARRALVELYGSVVGVQPDWAPGKALAADDVRSIEGHAQAYGHSSWLPHAAFLWSARIEPVSFDGHVVDDGPNVALARMVDRLARLGHEVIAVDLTAEEVRRCGLYVFRAIVPGLQPIGFGRFGMRLGGKRLYDAPVRMGTRQSPAKEEELNPWPHCFP